MLGPNVITYIEKKTKGPNVINCKKVKDQM